MPLARFYATHRAALPPVFRSIQIAPVWRAERPQKGRYRQFVQCDIDIIGEAGPLAELELLTATVATLDALGLGGRTIRLNDRRILAGILGSWGVPEELRERALITIDKLDKIGIGGVAAELAELGIVTGDADVAAELEALTAADWHLHDGVVRPPSWLDLEAYAELRALRDALPDAAIEFDPTLVRGMGYYTGTIFEIAHPDLRVLARRRRPLRPHDRAVPRPGGARVRLLDRLRAHRRPARHARRGASACGRARVRRRGRPARAARLKHELVASGTRVRFERRVKNLRALLDRVTADGFDAFATVTTETTDASSLAFRDLGA